MSDNSMAGQLEGRMGGDGAWRFAMVRQPAGQSTGWSIGWAARVIGNGWVVTATESVSE